MQQQIGYLQGTVRFEVANLTLILASKVSLVTSGLKMLFCNKGCNHERYPFWSLEFLRICEGSAEYLENLPFVSLNLTVPWGYLPGSATTNRLPPGHMQGTVRY